MYRIVIEWSTNHIETHEEATEEAAEKWLDQVIRYNRRFGVAPVGVNKNY